MYLYRNILPWVLVFFLILLYFYARDNQPSNIILPTKEQSLSSESPKNLETHRVTRVIDGDTIEIDGKTHVRYIGIDSPEIGQCFGDKSKEANSNLVLGKEVQIETDVQEYDKYNRLLAYVYFEGLMINKKLVETGYAKLLTIPPDVKNVEILKVAQREAQVRNIGLWSNNPTPCPN